MRFLRVIRTVLWSLFGVRRRADAARDLETTPPAVLIATGLVVLLVVIVTIASLVRYLTAGRPQPQAAQEASTPAQAAKRHGPITVRDTMEERVAACTACHTRATEPSRDGFSPRIAGKPAGYLFNQLASFRDGRRGHAP